MGSLPLFCWFCGALRFSSIFLLPWPPLGPNWPQHGPTGAQLDPSLTSSWLSPWTQLSQSCPQRGPSWGPTWPMLDLLWSTFAPTCLNLAQHLLSYTQVGCKLTPIWLRIAALARRPLQYVRCKSIYVESPEAAKARAEARGCRREQSRQVACGTRHKAHRAGQRLQQQGQRGGIRRGSGGLRRL